MGHLCASALTTSSSRRPRAARGLAGVVHQFCEYDVVVDTGKDNPPSCVDQVLEALVSRSYD